MTAFDEAHMARAVELAARGAGWVNPNPQVGCVIVRDGRVLGEGWHTRFGALHAEREALAACERAGHSAHGASAYVTLEPCCHTGKQPPCCDALIEAGIARVVVGSADPNPQVAGKGIARLRQAGIEVHEGVLRAQCDALNSAFFHYIATGRPLVIAKYACTLDGKAATRTGASRWVTGEEARRRAHADRARYAAIMVGVGTVIADDPLLSARGVGDDAHQPARVVCDARLRTPLTCQLVATAREQPSIIATCVRDRNRWEPYERAGCTLLAFDAEPDGRLPIRELLDALGARGLDSIIVEGGPTLLGSFFDERCVDRVQAYIAPKVFGGAEAPAPVGGMGAALPSQAVQLDCVQVERLGCDILVEGDARYPDGAGEGQERSCSQA